MPKTGGGGGSRSGGGRVAREVNNLLRGQSSTLGAQSRTTYIQNDRDVFRQLSRAQGGVTTGDISKAFQRRGAKPSSANAAARDSISRLRENGIVKRAGYTAGGDPQYTLSAAARRAANG